MSSVKVAVVTGGAGFIGSHMTELLLSKGWEVRVIDNLTGGRLANLDHLKTNPRLRVDTRDIRAVQPADPIFKGASHMYHFAGKGDIVPSITHPVEYMSVNVMGTVNMLEGARAVGMERFVYAASSSCYGIATEFPTSEKAPTRPEYPYALSKFLGEQTVMHWGQLYKFPVNSIRIFNAYGPRSRTTGAYGAVFGVFLAQKLANKPFTIVGDGTQTRDFIYVSDLVDAFFTVARSARINEIYNVGAGKPQSVNRLVELLGGVSAANAIHLPKRPGEPDCTWADITKITTHSGWKPKTSFEEGVTNMIKVIDYWKDAPVWDQKTIQNATEDWFTYLAR